MRPAALLCVVLACCQASKSPAGDPFPPDSGRKAKLYSDAQARRMEKIATNLVPNGTTKPKREVLKALGIDPNRVRNYEAIPGFMIVLEFWQVAPSYRLKWMVASQDADKITREDCPVYGVGVERIEGK